MTRNSQSIRSQRADSVQNMKYSQSIIGFIFNSSGPDAEGTLCVYGCICEWVKEGDLKSLNSYNLQLSQAREVRTDIEIRAGMVTHTDPLDSHFGIIIMKNYVIYMYILDIVYVIYKCT